MKKYFLLLVSILLLYSTCTVFAAENQKQTTSADFLSEYQSFLYNEDTGLNSLEINAIAQTPDGYIWAGGYSGLYRYDGSQFSLVQPDSRIFSIMALYTDSKGRLWIGTNDQGVACFEPDSNKLTFFSTAEGLASNAIRSICEDEHHNIYVGTVSYLSVISPSFKVTTLAELTELTYVKSLCKGAKGLIGGVTNSGHAFFLNNQQLVSLIQPDETFYYNSICSIDNKQFLLGTSSSQVYSISMNIKYNNILKNPKMELFCEIPGFNSIDYLYPDFSDTNNGFFLCGENGLGYLSADGTFTDLKTEEFFGSVCCVLRDYQGNIWFSSNKQGVLKLSHSPFSDIFKKAGLSSHIVNSVLIHTNELYVGCDDGLFIIDLEDYQLKDYSFLSYFTDVRIRHIFEDSNQNLWFSTYGADGLILVNKDGSVTCYNETCGTMGSRFRSVIELKDGTILAASSTGLTFFKNGVVTATIGEKDGLSTPQILCMLELEDGTILAGSDGDGIYVIKNQEIVTNIGQDEGLNSLVILRIIKCSGGCLYITSNAIYYHNNDALTRLTQFPSNNNYDAFVSDNSDIWISSSVGIFIVNETDLIENNSYSYTLLNQDRGLDTTLTANAWNCLDEKQNYYLCCSTGIRKISIHDYNKFNSNYNLSISQLIIDNSTMIDCIDGTYTIPADAKRLTIHPAILNYTLSNPLVHIYLEGFDDNGITVYQTELSPVSFTNMSYGKYAFHIQILDEKTGNVLRETVIPIYKEAQFFEHTIFKVYLFAVLCFVLIFFTYLLSKYGSINLIKRQYEEIRKAKESADLANHAKSQFLANMSHEIRTPINTIMGMDELILREDISPIVQQYASDIQIASSSLLTIVNDILDFSKIESGKMNIVEQEYIPKNLLIELATMLRVRTQEKDLEMILQFDENIPSKLFGDEVRIRQIILNILSNAVKYTEKGCITFTVSSQMADSEHVLLTVSVKDTGIGIHKEDIEKLFHTFERLDEKRNAHIQGTGLGLNITKELLNMMNSNLEVDSEYGEGSTFYFTLSQKIVDAAPTGKISQKHILTEQKNQYVPQFIAPKASILVVDDNHMNLSVIRGLLNATKIQIATCDSGKECLSLIKQQHYDVILLDHMMPEMDGIETLEHIQTEQHLCKETPVIILTANAIVGAKEEYLKKGFTDYLSKPIDSISLEKMLSSYLPKEKLQAYQKEAAVATEKSKNSPLEYPFEHLNVKNGLLYSGGKEDFYVTMLGLYEKQSDENLEKIHAAFAAQDWKNYTIYVHALKSTSKSIGADRLSLEAQALEKAGKAEDASYIVLHHLETLELYKEVLSEIHTFLNK